MKIWRMTLKGGSKGYEMWHPCRELGVVAITYYPLGDTDLSLYPMGEPKDLWEQLYSSNKARNLRIVAYEMKKGDIIYVKQGSEIVGRGVVKGPYKFDYESRLLSPIIDDPWPHQVPWSHQVPVDWDSSFEPINIKLGAEPWTVLELSGDRLQRLEDALIGRKPINDKDVVLPEEVCDTATFNEGARRQIAVNTYERDPEARRRCIAHYGTNCSACGFNFAGAYGEAGEGFIHVHHLTPLSQIGEEYEIDPVRDLRPVCPNCHAVIHRRNPAYDIEEVKRFLHQAG